jgi:chorismate mutase/prephenate dehydratase
MTKIKTIRSKIDAIDRKMLGLLNDRMHLSVQIGKIKFESNQDVFVPVREKEVISNLLRLNKGVLPDECLIEIYREILNASRTVQRNLRVSYFGPEATFTHLAAIKVFGKTADLIPVDSIKDVFTEIEKSRADYGVVPVENSTEGVINHTLDMFIESDLKIVSEIYLEVSHCLLSSEKSLEGIKKVYSHPQPIAQTRYWFEKNMKNIRPIEVVSTAEAARLAVKERHSAAIASILASEIYGLNIIASNIEDFRNNSTRFLVIGRKSSQCSGNDKTSLMLSIKDKVGILHDILMPFKKHGINLTKIESRPTKKKAWEYIFFIDLIGHVEDKSVAAAINELAESCVALKILGSYPVESRNFDSAK